MFGFGASETPAPGSAASASPWGMLGGLLAAPAAPPFDFNALFSAMRNDPVGDANRAYRPGQPSAANPFDSGFFKDSASNMSPEARIASQGRSATNQWAQLGGVPGVDPQKLQDIMGQMTPTPGPAPDPAAGTADPFFMRKWGMGPYSPDNIGERPAQIPSNGMTPYGPVGPGTSTLPPNAVAGDGMTNYQRAQPDMAAALKLLLPYLIR